MKKHLLLFLGFSIILSPIAYSSDYADRESWKAYVSEKLPGMVCKENNTIECFNAAVIAVESCLQISHDHIPKKLKMPADGARIGVIMTKCSNSLTATLIRTATAIQ